MHRLVAATAGSFQFGQGHRLPCRLGHGQSNVRARILTEGRSERGLVVHRLGSPNGFPGFFRARQRGMQHGGVVANRFGSIVVDDGEESGQDLAAELGIVECLDESLGLGQTCECAQPDVAIRIRLESTGERLLLNILQGGEGGDPVGGILRIETRLAVEQLA